jgi:hypothetical protein
MKFSQPKIGDLVIINHPKAGFDGVPALVIGALKFHNEHGSASVPVQLLENAEKTTVHNTAVEIINENR